MADALVAAGYVPALVALLGRWEGFKAAAPAAAPGDSQPQWTVCVGELVGLLGSLGLRRGPSFRRQVGTGGRGVGRGGGSGEGAGRWESS